MSDLDKAQRRFESVVTEMLNGGLATIEAINNSLGIIADAERQARHEMRAAEFTNCQACQSGLVLFLNDTPEACHESTQAVTQTLWESCSSCQAEYDDFLCSNAPETETHALDGHAYNGDDLRWQNGGA